MADQTPEQQPTDQAEPTRCPVAECEETVDYIALLDHLYADHDAWELCTAVADLVAVRDDAWDGRDRAREIAVALEQQNARLLAALRAIAALMECGCTTDDCPSHIARAAIQEADRG